MHNGRMEGFNTDEGCNKLVYAVVMFEWSARGNVQILPPQLCLSSTAGHQNTYLGPQSGLLVNREMIGEQAIFEGLLLSMWIGA